MPDDARRHGASAGQGADEPPDAGSGGPQTPPGGAGEGLNLHALARDWITLWQSELSALAVDREAQETWQTMLALWAGAAGAMLAAAPRERPRAGPWGAHEWGAREPEARRDAGGRAAGGPAGPAAAPGTASPAAAPDARDAEIERLGRHIADLEARLADLERGVRGGNGGHRRGPGRRRG